MDRMKIICWQYCCHRSYTSFSRVSWSTFSLASTHKTSQRSFFLFSFPSAKYSNFEGLASKQIQNKGSVRNTTGGMCYIAHPYIACSFCTHLTAQQPTKKLLKWSLKLPCMESKQIIHLSWKFTVFAAVQLIFFVIMHAVSGLGPKYIIEIHTLWFRIFDIWSSDWQLDTAGWRQPQRSSQ